MTYKQICKFFYRRHSLWALIGAALLLFSSSITLAVDRYWQVSSGDWSDPANWGGFKPFYSDNAYITNGGTANITQYGEACYSLYLGDADTGSIQMTGGRLSANDLYVGYSRAGMFTHTVSIYYNIPYVNANYLYLGYNSSASGTYNLSGIEQYGELNTSDQYIGYSGEGNFVLSGGKNTVNHYLYLGYNSGAIGNYNLCGTGNLHANFAYIGYSGTGIFTQTGENSAFYLGPDYFDRSLYLGYNSPANGTYNLGGGKLIAGFESIGYSGTGTFNHTAGINSITYLLEIYPLPSALGLGINSGASGTYNLSGTGQLSAEVEYIGYGGTGTFNHSAGSNTVYYSMLNSGSGALLDSDGPIAGTMYLGYEAGSSGTYNLSGSARLDANGEVIGNSGTGTFTQSGGTNTVEGLFLGNNPGASGTYNLNGGTLKTRAIGKGDGAASFNFGGGNLRAKVNFTTTMPMTLTGINGNAIVDPAGYNVTFSGVLSGPGGLINNSSILEYRHGTIILTAANTYQGETTILSGKLVLSATGTIDSSPVINVQSPGAIFDINEKSANGGFFLNGSQTLKGNGSVVGHVVASFGSHIAPGNPVGRLSIWGNLTLNPGAMLDFDLCPLNDKIYVSTLFLNNQEFSDFNFTALSGFGMSDYTLIDAGAISGTLGSNLSGIIGGLPASLAISGNDLVLKVVPEPGTALLLATACIALWAYAENKKGSELFFYSITKGKSKSIQLRKRVLTPFYLWMR